MCDIVLSILNGEGLTVPLNETFIILISKKKMMIVLLIFDILVFVISYIN